VRSVCMVAPCGDGGLATAAKLYAPFSLAIDSDDNILIADTYNHAIRMVDQSTGLISTLTGQVGSACSSGDCGDGGPAVSATLAAPMDVVPMPDGSFYVVEYGGHAVRYVTASDPGFRIGGTVSGLADGAQVVLQNNGGD